MRPLEDEAPMHHDLKSWTEYFEPVWRGDKTHEIRRADRDVRVGDTVRLREFLPDSGRYTGRVVRAVVTYVSRPGPIARNVSLPEGMLVFSFRVHSKAGG